MPRPRCRRSRRPWSACVRPPRKAAEIKPTLCRFASSPSLASPEGDGTNAAGRPLRGVRPCTAP
ncbi:hypothetical protein FSY45_11470 [Comamonas sp. Z1]|nr:hypothetical protein FSY45_11470 [Comamonas sp. Z1]